MKTTNQLSILACLLFIVISWATPAYAVWDHQWIDGIPYDNYDADAHTVSVSMYSSAPQGIYHFKGNYITIPGSVLYNGVRCTVNEIEHTAFPSCAPTIKTFSVPSTVKKIGSDIKWIGSVYLKSSDAVINKTSFSGLSKVFVPEGCGDFYRSQLDSAEYNKIVDSFKASGQLFAGSGSGTKDDPYLIFNPIQLNQVRHFLNEKYVHFRLMSDIDLSDWLADNNPSQGWQPIGTESSPFMGIFDGNNHKITGLRINRSTTDNVGFFGFMLWADIFNLTLEGSEIKGGLYVGSLAGQLIDCNIGNCSITIDTITGEDYTGGLAGCGSGDIINCKSYVSVNGNNRTGGFIGSSQNETGAVLNIQSCCFRGSVNGNKCASLCVGYNDHYLFLSSSTAIGKITANGSNIGGLIGYTTYKKLGAHYDECSGINGCSVYCDMICQGDTVGGIIGCATDSVRIQDSFIVGDIACSGSYVGGITGYISTSGIIKNTYYNGIITSCGDYVGGITGFANSTNIQRCLSYANIIGNAYVGGIAGRASASTITSNVSICGLISAVSGNVGRIYGDDDLSGVMLGENGTANENKGLATANVLLNGVALDLPDGLKHGTNVGSATLKLKATYQGMGWDFDDWTIVETESYPYKPVQCAPPVITSILEAKATEVSGNSIDGGQVILRTCGQEYITQTTDHMWTMQVDSLQAGAAVMVQADTDDKLPSYYELKMVRFGGSGTEEDPYSIYTAEDLQSINSYAYYKLMADIDLTEWINDNNPSGGWIPIGASGNATMKQLDGNGHKITGLWSDNEMENCGLFATTFNAIICDLTVYTANGKKMKGGTNTGTLAGYAESTRFENINIYADVEGNDNVGGIVGYCQDGNLLRCAMCGTVKGCLQVGGLAGESASIIQECYSQGSVTGTGTTCCVGGIVGYNRYFVENSYCDANIVAGVIDTSIPSSDLHQYAGGIVGDNSHTILNCYSTGNLFSVKCAAGIAGYNTSEAANVNHCYAMNSKIEVADASGIAMRVIGGIRNGAPAPEANNYGLNTMVLSLNNIPQTIYDDLLHGQSLTEATLKDESTYRDNGWDMDNVWNIINGECYPYLRSVEIQDDIPPEVVRGDANDDGDVTITDVVLAAQVAVGKIPSVLFIEANADVNGDGNINITDVVIIANIAVGKITMPRKTTTIIHDEADRLWVSELNINPGETQTIDVMLDNTRSFCGFQMDVELPENLELVNAYLSNRYENHDLLIGGNQVLKKLLAFSLGNDVFDNSRGLLLTLTLKANMDYASSIGPKLTNILFVEPDGNTIQFNDMAISNGSSSVHTLNDANVRIYGEKDRIIIESPVKDKAQVVTTSGVCRWVDVNTGVNEIPIQKGFYIVRMGKIVVKIKI